MQLCPPSLSLSLSSLPLHRTTPRFYAFVLPSPLPLFRVNEFQQCTAPLLLLGDDDAWHGGRAVSARSLSNSPIFTPSLLPCFSLARANIHAKSRFVIIIISGAHPSHTEASWSVSHNRFIRRMMVRCLPYRFSR